MFAQLLFGVFTIQDFLSGHASDCDADTSRACETELRGSLHEAGYTENGGPHAASCIFSKVSFLLMCLLSWLPHEELKLDCVCELTSPARTQLTSAHNMRTAQMNVVVMPEKDQTAAVASDYEP